MYVIYAAQPPERALTRPVTQDLIEQAYAGYVYGDSTCGQRALYALGLTQIPIVNVRPHLLTSLSLSSELTRHSLR